MELTLKEMAQIERARVEAAKKEEERIREERLRLKTEVVDVLFNEIKDFISTVRKSDNPNNPYLFIPIKGYPLDGLWGYTIYPETTLDYFIVHYRDSSCSYAFDYEKRMSKREFAEKVLSLYL